MSAAAVKYQGEHVTYIMNQGEPLQLGVELVKLFNRFGSALLVSDVLASVGLWDHIDADDAAAEVAGFGYTWRLLADDYEMDEEEA